MNDLDDPSTCELDGSGMLGHVAATGHEFVTAWEACEGLAPPPGAESARAVLVAGVGGSATAGDYFASICSPHATIPVSVHRGFGLPNWVSDETYVVVCSYSGNTEEALTAYDDAWKRGAPLTVITRGGKLGERARGDGVQTVPVDYDAPPRATMVHSLAPLLRLGRALDLCAVTDAAVRNAGALCAGLAESSFGPAVPVNKNRAKQVALSLATRVALVLGAGHLAPAARRLRNQLAENGKRVGAVEELPEAGHNLVVGLRSGTEAPSLAIVTIESAHYHPLITRRFAELAALASDAGLAVERFEPPGATPLDQLLAATVWADHTSCYVGLAAGEDPTPIPEIERLKRAAG
jgi:glucose/mannose-6-phosphate isomerase